MCLTDSTRFEWSTNTMVSTLLNQELMNNFSWNLIIGHFTKICLNTQKLWLKLGNNRLLYCTWGPTCISVCIPRICLLNLYRSEECVQHDIQKAACQTHFFCNCKIFVIINHRGFLKFLFFWDMTPRHWVISSRHFGPTTKLSNE